jgi:outer membrane biosynthesis protein TonB
VEAFRSRLFKFVKYPTSKAARKLKPFGTVKYKISVVNSAITEIEITESSGSPILDQAVKSAILSSDGGKIVGNGVVFGSIAFRKP